MSVFGVGTARTTLSYKFEAGNKGRLTVHLPRAVRAPPPPREAHACACSLPALYTRNARAIAAH